MRRRGFLTALSGLAVSPLLTHPGRADDAGPAWSYNPDAANGPTRWGKLDGYALCGTGHTQSPIELVYGAFVMPMVPIQLNWAALGGVVFDDPGHHTIKVDVNGRKLTTLLDGASYDVAEFHLHAPSEHTFRGEHKTMEVHVKHVPKDGITLVVGVMVETGTGPDTGLLGQILGAKPSTSGTPVPALRTAALIPPNRRFGFFRYAGSLTTPACDETVDWVVLDTPATARISTAQALELKSRYGPPQGMRPEQTILARPVQTASEHEVSWYRR